MPRSKNPRSGDSRKPPVTISETKSASVRNKVTPIDLEAEIRHRAYELYEQRGRVPGYEREDWLSAEREIAARYQPQQQRA